MTPDIVLLLDALAFSAEKHRHQRRKGAAASPYINHPIEVTRVLTAEGGVRDVEVLMASILHDTIEDTATTQDELRQRFGDRVASLVAEVTDDKGLPAPERKRRQVELAPTLSLGAKLIRVSNKICNVRDLVHDPPGGWSRERLLGYLDWSERVVAGCRGVNAGLEEAHERALVEGRAVLRA